MVNTYTVKTKSQDLEELPAGLTSNFQWGVKK